MRHLTWLAVACSCLAAPPEVDPAAVLKANGVDPTPEAVEKYLRGWIVDDRLTARIGKLIAQLGSEEFDQREQATEELARIGPAVIDPLRAAARSTDAEVRGRATDLLARVDSATTRQTRETLPPAAFQWLAKTKPAGAMSLILDLLPHLTSPAHREAAAAALWQTTSAGDAVRLRKSLAAGPATVRAAVLPALELAEGAQAVDTVAGYLKDADAAVRLAAARAVLDRQPKEAVAVLVALLDSPETGLRTQAAWLLQQVSGLPAEADRGLDWQQTAGRWRDWAAKGEGIRPAGAARLRLERYGLLFEASFAEAATALKDRYGPLRYETNCAGKASVVRGLARFDGQHAEGDQRLFVTAEKLLGRATFPKTFEVRAKLGGEAELSGGWHVGVSVGNVRVLFHPDYTQGGFRVERVDTQRYLHGNENMNFTPAAGVLHDMTLTVTENDDRTVTLDVRIADGKGGGRAFRRSVKVAPADIGALNRVALERSGRTGGAGLFGALSIRH